MTRLVLWRISVRRSMSGSSSATGVSPGWRVRVVLAICPEFHNLGESWRDVQ